MKRIYILLALFVAIFFCEKLTAQISFSVNLSSQPLWGPTGYDHVEYYYIPDIETYYYVPTRRYTYVENGHWVSRSYLPRQYRNYDMYNAQKVVINERKPYLRHDEYKRRYSSSNGHANQTPIRDSHDERYFENKNHPEHSKWKDNNKNNRKENGNGNHKNHNKNNGRGHGNDKNKR